MTIVPLRRLQICARSLSTSSLIKQVPLENHFTGDRHFYRTHNVTPLPPPAVKSNTWKRLNACKHIRVGKRTAKQPRKALTASQNHDHVATTQDPDQSDPVGQTVNRRLAGKRSPVNGLEAPPSTPSTSAAKQSSSTVVELNRSRAHEAQHKNDYDDAIVNQTKVIARAPLDSPSKQTSSAIEPKLSRATGPEPRGASEETISLLEELFPDEIRKAGKLKAAPKTPREIPYRPIDVSFVPEDEHPDHLSRGSGTRDQSHSSDQRDDRVWRHQSSTALILRNAGKHLVEEDFKQALPRGRHLEGWTTGGEGMKVIRGRDRNTLLPDGNYIILFRSSKDADAFLANARRLHSLAQIYTPKADSLGGPLPPPPLPPMDDDEARQSDEGLMLPNRSTHQELASYTLMPPSERLNLRTVQEPFSPFMRDLVSHSGYEQITRNRRTAFEVMLHCNGWQPTLQGIIRAINDDGKARHLHWDTENRSRGIREVLLRDTETLQAQDSNDNESSSTRHSYRVLKRWLVSFWKEDEARRFVSAWHRRNLAPLLRLREAVALLSDEEVVMNAEYIW